MNLTAAMLDDGAREHRDVRDATKAQFLDMNRVEPLGVPQVLREPGREILVDQEARRHEPVASALGRPRGGLALAWSAAASTASRSR